MNNKPIGIIGNIQQGKEWLAKNLNHSAQIYEIDNNANIDEIKEFRKILINENIQEKIGIIYLLNKFSAAKQAILLKIFEEMPEYNKCYFLASFLPNFTIANRSTIYYLKTSINEELIPWKNFMIKQMQTKTLSKEMLRAWKILLQTNSLYEDGIISEAEKKIILKGIGIE